MSEQAWQADRVGASAGEQVSSNPVLLGSSTVKQWSRLGWGGCSRGGGGGGGGGGGDGGDGGDGGLAAVSTTCNGSSQCRRSGIRRMAGAAAAVLVIRGSGGGGSCNGDSGSGCSSSDSLIVAVVAIAVAMIFS